MIIILFGPPGAGKGTQAEILSQQFNISCISTGDILRQNVSENTALGKTAKSYMDKGSLVPDQLVTDMVCDRLNSQGIEDGFILDGYPRNASQAIVLDAMLNNSNSCIDAAIYLEADRDTVVKRLSGRRVCRKCRKNYHIVNMPPKKEGFCDECGIELYQRDDDKEETIINRLNVYIRESTPVLDYYAKQNKLIKLDGNLDAQEVFLKIKELLSSYKAEQL